MSVHLFNRVEHLLSPPNDGGAGAGAARGNGAGSGTGEGGGAAGAGGGAGAGASGAGAGAGTGDGGAGEGGAGDPAAENARLKAALRDANRENQRRREALSKFDGIDPEKYRADRAAEEQREAERLRKDGEFEKLLGVEREKTKAQQALAEKILGDWHASEIRRELLQAAGSLKAIPQALAPIADGPSQVEAIYSGQFEFVDGKVVHKTARNDDGTRCTPTQFLEKERSTTGANLFAAVAQGGTGAQGGAGGDASGDVTIKRDDPYRSVKVQEAIKAGKKPRIVD